MKQPVETLRSPLVPTYGVFLCVFVLSFVTDPLYLLPTLSTLLFIILFSLFLNGIKTGISRHFILGVFSGVLLMIGKFEVNSYWYVSVGMFGLFFSAALNFMGNHND